MIAIILVRRSNRLITASPRWVRVLNISPLGGGARGWAGESKGAYSLGLPFRQPSAHQGSQGRTQEWTKVGPKGLATAWPRLGGAHVSGVDRSVRIAVSIVRPLHSRRWPHREGGVVRGSTAPLDCPDRPRRGDAERTPGERRGNAERGAGRRADRRPPGVGDSHSVGIGSRGGCCRGAAAGLVGSTGVRPYGVLGAAGAPVRSLILGGSTTRR